MGTILQILVVTASLLNTWLLSRKGKEKWGYLAGFLTIPLWAVMEAYYQQWFFFCLNPIYLWFWLRGLRNHWTKDKNENCNI